MWKNFPLGGIDGSFWFTDITYYRCVFACVCRGGGGGVTEIHHYGAGDFVIVTINRCFKWQFYTQYLIRYITVNAILKNLSPNQHARKSFAWLSTEFTLLMNEIEHNINKKSVLIQHTQKSSVFIFTLLKNLRRVYRNLC